MRKLLTAILDKVLTRYYIVEYDADEAMDLGYSPAKPPLSPFQCSFASRYCGSLDNGVFNSFAAAAHYLAMYRNAFRDAPILPCYVTRIPRNHPLVR